MEFKLQLASRTLKRELLNSAQHGCQWFFLIPP